jgi:hypothetical protein
MPTTDATDQPPQRHAFYISYRPEDFATERDAAEHFALHWAERLEEDLGIILGDDELAAATPEEVLLGGGAVFMFDQWRLVARMEVFDFASMSPGDESPVGRQKLVRCSVCGRTAFVEGYPLDLGSAHYLHWLRKDNGAGKAWEGCRVPADTSDYQLVTATFTYRMKAGGRARTADCMYDPPNNIVFNILMAEDVRHGFFTRPPAEAFVTLRDGKKLRPSGGIIFNYE